MGILWPHSNSVIFNNAGARASGAKIHLFEAGTTTPRTSYQDAALTTPHTHPVIADASGRAPAIFLDYGDYRVRVRTSGDTTIWDTDDIPNPTPVSDEDDVDPNSIFQTGDMIFAGKNGTRNGFVRCNGRTIGSATSTASERANPDCEALFLYLWDNYSDGQAAVPGGRGSTAPADWAANKRITLPDLRTAALIGFDDMGNSARSGIDPALVVSGSLIDEGSIVGANTHTLLVSQLPAHTHPVSLSTTANGAHAHTVSGTTDGSGAHTHSGTTGTESTSHTHSDNLGTPPSTNGQFTGPGGNGWGGTPAGATTGLASNSHTHSFSTTSDPGHHAHAFTASSVSTAADHQHSVSGNSGGTGNDFAHNIVQRSVLVTVLMKL